MLVTKLGWSDSSSEECSGSGIMRPVERPGGPFDSFHLKTWQLLGDYLVESRGDNTISATLVGNHVHEAFCLHFHDSFSHYRTLTPMRPGDENSM